MPRYPPAVLRYVTVTVRFFGQVEWKCALIHQHHAIVHFGAVRLQVEDRIRNRLIAFRFFFGTG